MKIKKERPSVLRFPERLRLIPRYLARKMAKENGAPTAAEKGKGKAEDSAAKDGKKTEEPKKDKDGKPLPNGKGKDEPEEGPTSLDL